MSRLDTIEAEIRKARLPNWLREQAYLLRAAGLAVVPLRAFGSEEDTGWFRLSVGAVSPEEIERVLPKVREALLAVR